MPFHDISEIETDAAFNAELRNASIMVISSHGKTIQPGGTYPMTAIATRNVGRVIIYMAPTLGRTSNGTSTNSDRINLTNCEGGLNHSANLKTSTLKNC
jgi:hypothetical protein